MTTMPSPTLCMDPIFILGILYRSGTNFLYDLLRLHPDCSAPPPIREDFLVHHSDLLIEFANFVSRHWNPNWGTEGLEDSLCRHLGDGVISFLNSHTDGKRLVTKTPSVRNLGYFFRLFPRAHLLILVRDGRAVVESGARTFDWNYEVAMQRWATAARTILSFDRVAENSFKYLIVRYEDLYSNLEEELDRIFAFANLDVEKYDFETAANLPTRGSSAVREQGDEIHWKPVEKTPDFNPLLRWSHWNRSLHERFNWIAGHYLVQFGYKKKLYTTNRPLWNTWNRARDMKWRMKELKRILETASRRFFRKTLKWD